jgi:hypothetical protein
MNQSQQSKFQLITAPAAIANNTSPATTSIDTQGYDYAEVFVILGATDIALTALKIQESDTDGSYGDVTGLIYGTSASIAGTTASLPSATDDNKCFKFEIDLRGRKRYLDLVYTIGNGSTGAFSTAFVLLSRAKDHPVSASERGFGNIVRLP